MREEELRKWMRGRGLAEGTIGTQLSKIRKLNRHFGDLDLLIEKGEIERIATLLADSAALPADLGNEGERNHLRQSLRYYRKFAAETSAPTPSLVLDRVALDRMKSLFLQRHDDFETFSDCPSFAESEGDYKRALVEEAQRLMRDMSASDDAEIGAALIELLAGRAGFYSNLIDWRAQKVIDKAREAEPSLVEAATGRLARADDVSVAIAEWLEELWPEMRDNVAGNPFAESRMFPTMLRALVDPQAVLPIRSTPTDNASRMLLGKPAFANAPLSPDELTNVSGMAKEMIRIMDYEWGWSPRDLWDVQGFIWETCQKVLRDDEMTDDELLMRFDGDERFRVARAAWSGEQRRAFCSIARTVHDAGLDWYHTNIPEIRFGRKNDANRDASGTLGSVQLRTDRAFVVFSHQNDKLGLTGSYEFNDERAADFASTINEAEPVFSDWKPTETKRPGRWPDEYKLDEATSLGSQTLMEPTNLILYGPPGTGKTYRTAREAVRLCDGSVEYREDAEGRAALMKRYRELIDAHRIEFVTFHQSFSYEEFVEGLRPPSSSQDSEVDGPNDRALTLDVHPGIFRDMAERAAVQRATSASSLDTQRSVFKIALGDRNHEEALILDALDEAVITLGWGGDIDWSAPEYDDLQEILERWRREKDPDASGKDSNVEQLFALRSWMQEGDYVVVSDGRDRFRAVGEVTGPYEYHANQERHPHRRKVRWLWRNEEGEERSVFYPKGFRRHSLYRLDPAAVDWTGLSEIVNQDEDRPANQNSIPHVLIIDEINRANISKVFGELITLIEPDKRLGMPNALKVRLPYSKREFGVPANLHIIGTMNTADRSIALLDTALRRRFRFKEMAPDTSVEAFLDAEEATGLPLAKVLEAINRRIEYLVDRDHRIGHAFFIGCKTKPQVDAVMRDKVIPLLQEYFFEDWNRLAAVLGEKDKGGNFLECETIEDPMGEGGEPLKSWRVRDSFDEGAYSRLVKGKPSSAVAAEVVA